MAYNHQPRNETIPKAININIVFLKSAMARGKADKDRIETYWVAYKMGGRFVGKVSNVTIHKKERGSPT